MSETYYKWLDIITDIELILYFNLFCITVYKLLVN